MVRLCAINNLIWSRSTIFFGGYSLYLVFSYIAFHSFTLFAPAGLISSVAQTLFLVTVLGSRIVVFIAVVAFSLRSIKIKTVVVVLVSCGTVLSGFLVCGMSLQFSGDVSFGRILPWVLLGGMCLGAGDALTVLLWARFCKTLTLRVVYLYVLVSNAFSLVIYFAATLLPPVLIIPSTAILFVASSICVQKSLSLRTCVESEYSLPVMKSAVSRLWRPVFGTAVFCFMSGLMMQISGQQELSLLTVQQTSILSSAVVVVILLLPTIFVLKPPNVGSIYKIALPLSAAGFLLLPIIWNAAGGIVNAFAQLGSMVASILLWCMLADMARDTQLPSSLVFSLALICTNGAQLLGVSIGFFNAESFTEGSLALTVVALVSLYLLSMLSLFVFRGKKLNVEDPSFLARQVVVHEKVHEDQWFSNRCAEISQKYHLTVREKEIFILLAQGRTVHSISEKLFVSENTVKSHIKSIYQKSGIHLRSELIDLVNAVEGE